MNPVHTMTEGQLVEALEALFAEGSEAARRREQGAFDEAAHPLNGGLVLFGAGNLGRKTLQGLRKHGQEPLAFADNEPRLWGTQVDGVTVLSPQEAASRYGATAVFVLTIWRGEGTDRMPDRIAQVRALGCERVIPFTLLFWKHAEAFLPHYLVDLPHRVINQREAVLAAARLWADGPSRVEFLAQIRLRLLADFALPEPVAHEIYFPEDLFALAPDEVFIDCGAFDGDTLRRYLARYPDFAGQFHTFEPDPKNFAALEAWAAAQAPPLRDRIRVYPYAVGASRKKVRFDATGTEAAAVGSGSLEVECVALDEVLAGTTPTYLKMDVEGSEPAGITGAKGILQKHAPALALCIYHRQNHLWAVPNLVQAANPGAYCFFLRPHLLEGWDTVCYAVPAQRLNA